MDARSSRGTAYDDQPSSSPWIAQLAPDGPPRPLDADADADVVIVGAGIAGVATAFFTVRSTTKRVLLVERDRVGRGATGRNAVVCASVTGRSRTGTTPPRRHDEGWYP